MFCEGIKGIKIKNLETVNQKKTTSENVNKCNDYSSDTPSNSSSLVSSNTGRLFGKKRKNRNTRSSSSIRGKTVSRKELGAIPKTEHIQLEDFLDKTSVPSLSPSPLTQLVMEPFVVKMTQGESLTS